MKQFLLSSFVAFVLLLSGRTASMAQITPTEAFYHLISLPYQPADPIDLSNETVAPKIYISAISQTYPGYGFKVVLATKGTLTFNASSTTISASSFAIIVSKNVDLTTYTDLRVGSYTTSELDAGTYYIALFTDNLYGMFNISIITTPSVQLAPTATTNTATSVSSTGATLNGSINANGSSAAVTFEYGLTTSYGISVAADQSPVTGGSSTSVSKAITGLTANTTYHYRVKGVSSEGTSNGLDQTFTTLAPSLALTSNAPGNTLVSGTSVTFTATPSGSSATDYLWKKNGVVISGETNSTYTTSDLVNGDVISAQLAANTGTIASSGLVLLLDAGNQSSYPGSGSTWTDLSGNSNNATLPSALVSSYSSSVGAGSFNFNGSGSTTIQSNAINNWNITTTNALSVETWIKRTNYDNYNFWFSTPDLYYRLGVTNSGYLFWDMGHYVDRSSGILVSEGVWHHIVYTAGIESGNITTRVYLDGTPVVSQNEGISSLSPFTDYLIGDGQRPGQHPLNGNMGLIRVYNKALSPSEVSENYSAEVDRFSTAVLSSNSLTMTVNTPPLVSSVTSTTANGTYKSGDVISITVDFSKAVTVTGTPKLALNSGGTASYSSGSGTSTLTFTYTVGAEQSSADLDYSSTSSLSQAGGTIKDAAANDAVLTLPTVGGAGSLGGQKNIVIGIVPTVTTQPVSSITSTTAIGNGNITDLGSPNPTAYGVCWNTSGSPTTSDSKVDKGAASATGAFTASMTGLTAGTTYYVRAFATNAAGTSYGSEVSFTTTSFSLSGSTGGTSIAQNTPVYIASAAEVTGATLNGAIVSISNNFNSTQDVLGIDGVQSGTSGSISYSYNSSKGILTLSGDADVATYQSIIRKLTYTNTSVTPSTASRSITVSLNKALPYSANGHYYEFVSSSGITWTSAKVAAEGLTYFGLKGYLATITSAAENDFCTSKLSGDGWMGATDADVEGTWKWVTGPEAGHAFSEYSYTNWNVNQPDNYNGVEDYAQLYVTGKWNDLPNSEPSIVGYVVEYGGSADDPTIDISDVVIVNFAVPVSTVASGIQSNSFQANWQTLTGATAYYLDVATNSSFTTMLSGYNNKNVENVTTYKVEGLNPATPYYYRVRATALATGYNSNISSATTTKADQTITFPAIAAKTYGDATFTLGDAKTDRDLTVTYTAEDPSVVSITGNQATILKAGTTKITATQAGDGSNFAATPVERTLTVDKAELTVTADNQTKAYGADNPTLTFQYSGWVNGEETIDTPPTISTTVNTASLVGVYSDAITLSGGSDNNYAFNYVAGDFEVAKAELMVIADNQTKVYGSINPKLTFHYSGWINGDETIDTPPTISTTVDVFAKVDTYVGVIKLSGGSDDKYTLKLVPGDFEVTKAELTVKADNQTKVYGSTNPTLTFQYSGWVDEVEKIDTPPTILTTVDGSSVVGTYANAITLVGGADNNYTLKLIPGNFEVTKAELTVAANDQSKCYDGKVYVGDNNAILSGFVNGEDQSDLEGSLTFIGDFTDATLPGNYAIVPAGLTSANYKIVYRIGNLTIRSLPTAKVSSDQEICAGSSATINVALTGEAPWTVTVFDGTKYQTIENITKNLYTFNVTGDAGKSKTYTITEVSDFSGCSNTGEGSVTVTVRSYTFAGEISGDQLIAPGKVPAPIVSVSPGSGDGTITYAWQSSVDQGYNWEVIPEATGETYSPEVPEVPVWFRRIAIATKNGVSCSAVSEPVKIKIWGTGIIDSETTTELLKAFAVRNTAIHVKGDVSKLAVARLYDIQGRLILVKNLQEGSLNVIPTNIRTGIYLLVVKDGERIQEFKLPVRE